MNESAAISIAMGKARVTPIVNVSATNGAGAAHGGGATAAAGVGAAAAGRAETGEVRKAHAGVGSCGTELLEPDMRAGCDCRTWWTVSHLC